MADATLQEVSNSSTILVVPGSLRTNSSSYKLINIVSSYLPAYHCEIYRGTGNLPHFDDSSEPSSLVTEWREKIAGAAGVIFITPEYAYGVPGTLKNALDWIVGSGDLVEKPTVLITAATGGEHAHQALLWILGALTALPRPGCELLISFIRSKLDEQGNIIDLQLASQLKAVAEAFAEDIKNGNNKYEL